MLLFSILTELFLPTLALAGGAAQEGINAASGTLPSLAAPEFGTIAGVVALYFVPIVNGVAITVVVVSGFITALSQSEEQFANARRSMIGGVIAIILVNVAEPIRQALAPSSGSVGVTVTFGDIGDEFIGVADWLTSATAVIAVLMIIVSGIRTVVSYGSDSGLQHLKRTVLACIAGFTIIALRFAIAESLTVTGTPGTLTAAIITAVNVLLGFVGLLAVIVIVIAGIMMIANIGNDDQYQKAKNLILRVAIGLVVIIASAAIINLVFVS
jgi:hypothetical protein